jgi:hypothetical protein
MLAGTSAYGRRGGIFGTLFAVAAMTLYLDWSARKDLDISIFATAAVVFGAGLIVTRLVETYGRPLSPSSGDGWNAAPTTSAANWTPDLESWSPTTTTPNRWDEGPWGSGR